MLSRTLTALLVLLALQFVPGVGVGEAQAGCIGSVQVECDTREEAYAFALQNAQSKAAVACVPPTYQPPVTFGHYKDPNQLRVHVKAFAFSNTTQSQWNCASSIQAYWPAANGGCPAGTTWNNDTYTCYSADRCLSMDNYGEGGTSNLSFSAHRCKAGCNFDYIGETQELTTGVGAVIKVGVQGKWKANGAACQAGDMDMEFEDENPPPVSCTPTDDGQTLCVKATGEQCYSAGEGRQICWRPGETGEKVDGPILQKRVGGVVVGEPGRTPPYGAMYEPAAAGVEVMAKYGGFREGGSPSAPSVPKPETQITTTTQNFSTTTNVNAGGGDPDQGENADGTPGSTPGNQGEGGSEGGGVPGDANGNGQPDWTEGAAPAVPGDGEPGEGDEPGPPSIISMGVSMLDETGFLTPATCPALGVLDFGPFGEFDMDSFPVWCDLVAIMRAIVLIMAAFASLKILMGSKD